MLLTRAILQPKFDQGMTYVQFLALAEPLGHRPTWDERHGRLALAPAAEAMVKGFARDMNVLCLTGTWCGDCALQGSAMSRIAEANPRRIALRFLQRTDEHADLITRCAINGGFRVPMTWFMAEDFEPVAVFGDRTLSRYRSMARKALPPEEANVLAPPPADPVRAVLGEVLDLFERAQLLLRLSTRLRERHGD